jgi:acetyltransferase EpsM
MKQIVLFGAGGHARVVWDTLRLMSHRDDLQVTAVLDDDPKLWGQAFMGIKIAGPLTSADQIKLDAAIVAIGDNRARYAAYGMCRSIGIPLMNVIHPSAVIGDSVTLGTGIVAFANVVVNIGTHIGDNVILNTACTIDHDCEIGAHAHIAPGVHLAGGVRVGEGALMGIGATAIPGVSIGRWVTIGAGSVVLENMPDQVTAAGSPARIIKPKG